MRFKTKNVLEMKQNLLLLAKNNNNFDPQILKNVKNQVNYQKKMMNILTFLSLVILKVECYKGQYFPKKCQKI